MTTVEEYDLYADSNQPVVSQIATVYNLRTPNPASRPRGENYFLYVEVDNYGLAHIQDHSHWLGKQWKNMEWQEQREVYLFLIEWEYIEIKQIGPEDSEYFGTTKLAEARPMQ